MTVDEALAAARRLGLARLDAALLLAHHLQCRREWLLAHPEAPIDAAVAERVEADARRRADGVPLAYLTGHREFMGLDLLVDPAVLVPRPETELLADWALERLHALAAATARPQVIDLGTGSGALAIVLAEACPQAAVTATDISEPALRVARANAIRLGADIRFVQCDWWSAVAGGARYDLAVANPPYVAPGDPHLAALRHEPSRALVAEDNGLAALRRIVEQAPAYLSGWLLLEHGWDQAEAVHGLLAGRGFREVTSRSDLSGHWRCSGGLIG